MIKENMNVKLVLWLQHVKCLFDVRLVYFSISFKKKKKKIFLAALRIEKGLKDIDTIEEEEVTLEVVLSKSDARGKWLKDGKILYPDQK
jgi:hypothetical protein